jgi:hypothetical protein
MAEAELFLNRSDYRSALVGAIASDLVRGGPKSPSRLAIETICLYQLGDRKTALALSESVATSSLSPCLRERFVNTVEVLQFMPQLLSLLKQQH